MLAGYRAEGNRRGEAIALGLIGNCHKRLGDRTRALDLLGRALEMKRELGDEEEVGRTLSHLSVLTPDGPALDLPIDIRQLGPGQTVKRWGYVNVFLASGQQYSLRWGFGDVFPASHLAVTCVAGTEAGCTSWRVAPVGRGLLRRVTKVNRKTTQIDAIGWFEVPFDLTLTVR